jgi:hypothetical protein
MRLIRLCTNYPVFLNALYAGRPELTRGSYHEQYRALCAQHFSWADCWTSAFTKIGYTVWEPVANARAQQQTWARENGVAYDPDQWLAQITLAQVEHFQPDIVMVNDYATFTKAFFAQLRERVPGVRLVAGWCGAPYTDATVFEAYDVVLSNIPTLVDGFRQAGHRSELMAHCFDPRLLPELADAQPSYPFTFVGSLVKRPGFHNQRELLLDQLCQRAGLTVFADLAPRRRLAEKLIRSAAGALGLIRPLPLARNLINRVPRLRRLDQISRAPKALDPLPPAIRRAARPAVFGLEMFRTLAQSQLTLNTHIDIALAQASNMRLFEATGVGACLLTERQSDLARLFEPDVEVATYAHADEAVEKALYLLAHPEARRAIAAAGQRRTLRAHTFDLRAQWLDGLFQELLRGR